MTLPSSLSLSPFLSHSFPLPQSPPLPLPFDLYDLCPSSLAHTQNIKRVDTVCRATLLPEDIDVERPRVGRAKIDPYQFILHQQQQQQQH